MDDDKIIFVNTQFSFYAQDVFCLHNRMRCHPVADHVDMTGKQSFFFTNMLTDLLRVYHDPTDKPMMATVLAAEALAGRDRYCMNFIKAYREKRLEF